MSLPIIVGDPDMNAWWAFLSDPVVFPEGTVIEGL